MSVCRRGSCFATSSVPAVPTGKPFHAPKPAAPFCPVTSAAAPHSGLAAVPNSLVLRLNPPNKLATGPMFDPSSPDALVLNNVQWQEGKGKLPSGQPVVSLLLNTDSLIVCTSGVQLHGGFSFSGKVGKIDGLLVKNEY